MAHDLPDGLDDGHIAPGRALQRHGNWLSIVLLGLLMAVAMTGLLGGGRSPVRRDAGPAATLAIDSPATLRNGMVFETRIRIEAHGAIAEPTLRIPAALWRDMTINSQFPDAKSQGVEDGDYVFTYDPLAPGAAMEVKFDGQVNPPLTIGTRGTIVLADGDRRLAAVPLAWRVLP